jgi:hypothetical protein
MVRKTRRRKGGRKWRRRGGRGERLGFHAVPRQLKRGERGHVGAVVVEVVVRVTSGRGLTLLSWRKTTTSLKEYACRGGSGLGPCWLGGLLLERNEMG